MSNRFVSLNHGERSIHWLKLAGFAILMFVVVPGLVGIAWYAMTGRWSVEAFFVGGVLSILLVIRSVLRAYSIPERELNPDAASPTVTRPRG